MASAKQVTSHQISLGLGASEADPAGAPPTSGATERALTLAGGERSDPLEALAGAVTVVLVTFDSEDTIVACLEGIPRECFVHVVDNASRDATLARIAAVERPSLHVTRMDRNEGFGRACNRALREVKTPQALLLNPDAAIAPAALARLSAALAASGDMAVIAPRVIETGATPHEDQAGEPRLSDIATPSGPGLCLSRDPESPGMALHDVSDVTGSCMLVHIERLRQIGFFDESIFLYYEDSDLCWRARAAGFRVCLAADEIAMHRSGDSSSALRKGDLLRERLLGQSYAFFTERHHPNPRRRIARKALSHFSAGIGCLVAGRPARARMRFARMRGIVEYMLKGRNALWTNRLANR